MTAPASADLPRPPLNANLRGIGWMLLTGVLFVCVTGVVRHLGSGMNPMEAAFVRYALGFALLTPMLLRAGPRGLRTRRLRLHLFRGAVHGFAVMMWFFAMTRIPIAEVTALGFTAPIFTTLGAALFLGERLRARRVVAVLAGFAGALVILRPGIAAVDIGAVAQLVAAPLFATSFLLAKKLTESESNTVIVAYMAIFVTLSLLVPALVVWRAPTLEEMGWLCAVAALATTGHWTLTQAFRSTQITVTQPVQFLQLVWATLLGMLVFDEQPSLWTWIGGGIIVGSATYIAHREAVTTGEAEPKFGET